MQNQMQSIVQPYTPCWSHTDQPNEQPEETFEYPVRGQKYHISQPPQDMPTNAAAWITPLCPALDSLYKKGGAPRVRPSEIPAILEGLALGISPRSTHTTIVPHFCFIHIVQNHYIILLAFYLHIIQFR